jgi:hypothetical protein
LPEVLVHVVEVVELVAEWVEISSFVLLRQMVLMVLYWSLEPVGAQKDQFVVVGNQTNLVGLVVVQPHVAEPQICLFVTVSRQIFWVGVFLFVSAEQVQQLQVGPPRMALCLVEKLPQICLQMIVIPQVVVGMAMS